MDSCRIFLEALRQRRQSEATIRSVGFAFAKLDVFLKSARKELADVTSNDLDRFGHALAGQGLASLSVDLILRHVRRLFHWLAGTGRIFLDPSKGWSMPRPARLLPRVPTEQEVASLLAQPDLSHPRGIRDRALMEMAYSTGARLEELRRLTVFDADLAHGLLRVLGKGNKERMLPLGQEAVKWLREYVAEARDDLAEGKPRDFLWPNRKGRPITGRAIRMLMSRYSRSAGLSPISPHALRRACATHMLQRGAHPIQIQFLLGHGDTGTLGQYLRLSIQDIRAMHAAGTPGQ